MSPVAQAQAERIVAPEERDAYVQEFFQDGDVTPVVDGSGGLTDAEIEAFHQAVRDAQQSGPLNDEIIAGEMLSDKIILPPQVDKATSDEAEVAVAQQQSQTQTFATTAATCQYFPFSPHQVCGAILQRYNQMGGLLSILLDPIGRQIQNPDGVGFHQQFRNGFIFWHPDTGAHAITARNAEVFARNGWSAGWMGYPLGGEVPVAGVGPIDGEFNGWVQLFQGGRIYRTPILEGFQVASINGLILDKWLELGGTTSELGFPIADEAVTSDGRGRFSVFQLGSIYWHPDHGTHVVSGAIQAVWLAEGAQGGRFGYPISDEYLDEDANVVQDFSRGTINLKDYFNSDELVTIDGVEVPKDFVDFLDIYLGVDWTPGSSSSSSASPMARAAQQWNPPQNSDWNHEGKLFRVVSPHLIPVRYEYDEDLGTLNDFCTMSQDIWGENTQYNRTHLVADFRGPCAIHDLCYLDVPAYDNRVLLCDPQLRTRLKGTCTVTYGNAQPAQICRDTGSAMYQVVKHFQRGKNALPWN